MIHARQFLQNKKKTKLAPIYVLYGKESFFIQKVLDKIEAMFHIDEETDYHTYDMETTPVQEAILDAETFSLFGSRKLIIINRAYFLTGQNKKSDVEHDLNYIESYAQNPAEFSTVVIIAPYEKLDNRKKIVKALKENGELIECASPKLYEMPNVIVDMAKEFNLNLDDELVALISDRVGDNIEALQQELEKLSLYFNQEKIIFDEAEKIISTHSETSTFTLIDAITELNLPKSLQIIKQLKKQQEEPIALVALISSQIRMILQTKLLRQKGFQQQQIASQIQANPYAVKMALKREKIFSIMALKQFLMEATNADEQIKTGKTDPWLALELLIEKMITYQSNERRQSI